MAKVYLRINDGREIVDLPQVCMKCGAPATIRKSKQFSWFPPWIGVFAVIPLVYIILASILTKRQRVETTFCEQHRSYWWLYPLVMWLVALGLLGFGIVGAIAVSAVSPNKSDDLGAFFCLGIGVLFVALLIGIAIYNATSRIRVKEITDVHVCITGVSQDFADAVDEDEARNRRAFDYADDQGRRPRRPRDDDDDPRYTR
jgi:hypothetical protein